MVVAVKDFSNSEEGVAVTVLVLFSSVTVADFRFSSGFGFASPIFGDCSGELLAVLSASLSQSLRFPGLAFRIFGEEAGV